MQPPHLHLGVLRVHPDVDIVDIDQIAGHDTEITARRLGPLPAILLALGDRSGAPRHVQIGQQRVHQAVGRELHQVGLDARRDHVAIGGEDLGLGRKIILDDAHGVDVERDLVACAAQNDGAALARGMAHAELVKHVGIAAGDVDDRHVGGNDPLDHVLLHDAGLFDVVGADAVEAGRFDRGADQLLVDGVEIDLVAGDRMCAIAAIGHDDEAGLAAFTR